MDSFGNLTRVLIESDASGVFSLDVIFTKLCPIDLVCNAGLIGPVVKAMILTWWDAGYLAGGEMGGVYEIIGPFPDLDLQFTALDPEGIPLMLVQVFRAGPSWQDLDPVN